MLLSPPIQGILAGACVSSRIQYIGLGISHVVVLQRPSSTCGVVSKNLYVENLRFLVYSRLKNIRNSTVTMKRIRNT